MRAAPRDDSDYSRAGDPLHYLIRAIQKRPRVSYFLLEKGSLKLSLRRGRGSQSER